MAKREVLEACFIDVIKSVCLDDVTCTDQRTLGAVFMASAIQAAMEEASANGTLERERARTVELLDMLRQLAARWTPQAKDIADAIYAAGEREFPEEDKPLASTAAVPAT